jgi:hypothetical protein
VKSSQPRKERRNSVTGRTDAAAPRQLCEPAPTPKRRREYTPEVNTPESNIEFLECLRDLVGERIDEARRDLAKGKTAPPKPGEP